MFWNIHRWQSLEENWDNTFPTSTFLLEERSYENCCCRGCRWWSWSLRQLVETPGCQNAHPSASLASTRGSYMLFKYFCWKLSGLVMPSEPEFLLSWILLIFHLGLSLSPDVEQDFCAHWKSFKVYKEQTKQCQALGRDHECEIQILPINCCLSLNIASHALEFIWTHKIC